MVVHLGGRGVVGVLRGGLRVLEVGVGGRGAGGAAAVGAEERRDGGGAAQGDERLRELGPLVEDLLRLWHVGDDLVHVDERLAQDAVLVLDGVELRLEHVVLLGELNDALLEDHVVEAPLLAGPLGRLVVAAPPVPVGLVLLVLGDEFALLALCEDLLLAQLRGELQCGGNAQAGRSQAYRRVLPALHALRLLRLLLSLLLGSLLLLLLLLRLLQL